MNKDGLAIATAMMLAGCSRQNSPQDQAPAASKGAAVEVTAPPKSPPKPLAKPVPKPRPTIDPKSTAAAEELVRGFADLLNAGKFDQAYMLLGPAAPPRAKFDDHFARVSNLQATLGEPGDQEGAAGSIYLSVPLTLSGEVGGKHVSRSATAILRRVNDVPGSTEAQRHWHIERIDWGSTP